MLYRFRLLSEVEVGALPVRDSDTLGFGVGELQAVPAITSVHLGHRLVARHQSNRFWQALLLFKHRIDVGVPHEKPRRLHGIGTGKNLCEIHPRAACI